MRTRNQSKRRQNQSAGKESVEPPPEDSTFAEMVNDGGTLTDISRDAVGTLLKRVNSRSSSRLKKREKCLHECDLAAKPSNLPESTGTTGVGMKTEEKNDEHAITLPDMVEERKLKRKIDESGEEMDEEFWEDGSLPSLKSQNCHEADIFNGVTIEFDQTPDTGKRKTVRRASAQDKEFAELVHKVHLLCLLGRGRIIDNACNDPIIQASLLSVLPKHLLNVSEVKELTVGVLAPLLRWFHNNFRIKSSSSTERPFQSALAFALETQEGTAEEVAALSVACFRALNLTTRFVSILDVASLKPDTEKSEHLSEITGRGIFQSSTLMVDKQEEASQSVVKQSSNDKGKSGRVSDHKSPSTSSQFKEPLKADHPIRPCKAHDDSADACLDEKAGGSKRKGDLEFELQLQMALSATEVGTSNPSTRMDTHDSHNGSSNIYSPAKRIKTDRALGSSSSSSPQQISTAFGARKVGPPLYWAEVYCNGENSTGKWVHVDVVNAIIDGEQKVESAAAACKKMLRYAVAFAGLGAKDVTRRYCTKWYKIASHRVDPIWWDAVLRPLKELESRATGDAVRSERDNSSGVQFTEADTSQMSMPSTRAPKISDRDKKGEFSTASTYVASRSSLEDMELETKALTEPLPTNQQAYKNHHLYALERWLTKYQILHPKGPVLGFCSGHPVYPRTCVQMLHTKERWLQEGLQVKVNEVPAKVVKRSLKLNKSQTSLADNHDEESSDGKTVLYGKWQTEPLHLPPAVDGIVPKNERGQVDVWSEKCLPPGTVHLRYPRLAPVARRLGIDFAHAMVGFEFRSGRSTPVFEGIVVCAEFKDAIMEAYVEVEEMRKAEEKKKLEAQALSRWYQLLSSIVTRQRLNICYGDGLDSQTFNRSSETKDKACVQGGGVNESSDRSPGHDQKENLAGKSFEGDSAVPSEDHEHVFITDDQTVDEESSITTKRCHCGFSIQVEEL